MPQRGRTGDSMRIITGKARNIPLKTLEGDDTRPTSERVKEAVFSMLQFEIEGRRVLDLFAGSGQLGLEALSRGASHATFIDNSRAASDIIIENAKKRGCLSCAVCRRRIMHLRSGETRAGKATISCSSIRRMIQCSFRMC